MSGSCLSRRLEFQRRLPISILLSRQKSTLITTILLKAQGAPTATSFLSKRPRTWSWQSLPWLAFHLTPTSCYRLCSGPTFPKDSLPTWTWEEAVGICTWCGRCRGPSQSESRRCLARCAGNWITVRLNSWYSIARVLCSAVEILINVEMCIAKPFSVRGSKVEYNPMAKNSDSIPILVWIIELTKEAV